MENVHVKRYPASQVSGICKLKITMRYYYLHSRMATIKMTEYTSVGENVEGLKLTPCLWKYKVV